jgi:hypothetical protein
MYSTTLPTHLAFLTNSYLLALPSGAARNGTSVDAAPYRKMQTPRVRTDRCATVYLTLAPSSTPCYAALAFGHWANLMCPNT